MKLTLGITLSLACLLSTGQAFGQDPKLGEELKKFAGTWQLESIKVSGKELPKNEVENVVAKFKGNEIHVTKPDGGILKVEFKLDLESKPALIDFSVESQGKRVTFEGIYKFEKEKLIFCANLVPDGKNRPTEFASSEGSTTILEVLRRLKE